jgi:hypothetical protein
LGARWDAVPGVAVDAQDNVYVFVRGTPPVQVYNVDGNHLRSWGEELVGKAHHMTIDRQGNVWLADIGNHVVMKCSPDGELLMSLGTRGVPGCDAMHFHKPTDVVVVESGDIFVCDGYGNDRVVHFDATGRFVKEWGELGTAPGQFSTPHAIAADAQGRLYIADRNNVRIQVFDQQGDLLDIWSNLLVPWGFWVTNNDEIWVCGSSPMRWRPEDIVLGCPPKDQLFMSFNSAGKLLQLVTVPKGEDGNELPGECNWLHCVAFDSKGNLYAGDIQGKRAQKFVRQPPSESEK